MDLIKRVRTEGKKESIDWERDGVGTPMSKKNGAELLIPTASSGFWYVFCNGLGRN